MFLSTAPPARPSVARPATVRTATVRAASVRPVTVWTGALAVTGGLAITGGLAGCAPAAAPEETQQTSNYVAGGSDSGAVSDPTLDTSAAYRDGDYTATGTYNAPRGPETIGVSLTLVNDIVVSVEVTPDAVVANSVIFQGKFASAVGAAVVGVDIDSLTVDKLAGSSLTGAGFMDAIAAIKEAAAE